MGRVIEYAGRELRWMPSKDGTEHELRDKEFVIGSIVVEGKLCSNAVGKCIDGSWKFGRNGMLKSNVSVKEIDREAVMALFKKNALNRNGKIHINKKPIFEIKSNPAMTEYIITSDKGAVLTISNITKFPTSTSSVMVHTSAVSIPELSWLILFSWYLVIMQQVDAMFNSGVV